MDNLLQIQTFNKSENTYCLKLVDFIEAQDFMKGHTFNGLHLIPAEKKNKKSKTRVHAVSETYQLKHWHKDYPDDVHKQTKQKQAEQLKT